jgi:cobyrinic acid a,c-diamide synthase
MYLTEFIETTDKKKFEMAGVIPGSVHMQTKLAALGYREITGQNANFILEDMIARGHEFHYSTFQALEEDIPYAYETIGMRGVSKEGYLLHNLAAGYTHSHFASCFEMVENWIKKCLENRGKDK